MASLNLQRNSEVFFSTVSLLEDGVSSAASMTPSNTWKLEVLAGYAVTSSAATQDITSMESGTSPDRSQQRFNTSINPVDWNFQTYIRPTGATNSGAAGLSTPNTTPTGNSKPVADWFMWQSLVSNTIVSSAPGVEQSVWKQGVLRTDSVIAATGSAATRSNFASANENHLYVVLDSVIYQVVDATVNQATIDAGIDAIATTTWSGQGTRLVELRGTARERAQSVFGDIGTLLQGNANAANLQAQYSYHPYSTMNVGGTISTHAYIKNRLSTIEINHTEESGVANTYNFPVTALSFDYNNNITYVTPEELAVLNTPIGQFTGTRAVTGSATMYLRNGNNESGQFLRNISADSRTNFAQAANANIVIGGTTAPYVSFFLPAVQFEFPQLAVEDVVTMSVNFVAQEPTASKGEGGEVVITAKKA